MSASDFILTNVVLAATFMCFDACCLQMAEKAALHMQVQSGGRSFVKRQFYFKAGELPSNYHQVQSSASQVLHGILCAHLQYAHICAA